MEKEVKAINKLLDKEKMNRKRIYENLLANGDVQPNSEKYVYSIIDLAIENGSIKANRIKTYRKKRNKLPDIFTKDQLITIFDYCTRPKLAIVIWIGFFCGLRIREACNLLRKDVNLEAKLIKIRDSKNTNRSRQGYGKDRVVSIPDIAISPLKKWLKIINGGKWFIPSMNSLDYPIRTKTIHEQFRELLNECGLSEVEISTKFRAMNHGKKKDLIKNTYKYRFHTLRHTYASYLLDKGVPIENIQRSLGHESIDTTLIYAKISDKKTNEFINEAFNSPTAPVQNEPEYVPNVQPSPVNVSPLEMLQQRLIKGEIDTILYNRLLSELKKSS